MRKLWAYIKGFFTKDIGKKALEIAKIVAALTPTRGDDELIALFERYLVPNLAIFLQLPVQQRGIALLEAAATELGRHFPDASRTALDAAVISAVGSIKGLTEEPLP